MATRQGWRGIVAKSTYYYYCLCEYLRRNNTCTLPQTQAHTRIVAAPRALCVSQESSSSVQQLCTRRYQVTAVVVHTKGFVLAVYSHLYLGIDIGIIHVGARCLQHTRPRRDWHRICRIYGFWSSYSLLRLIEYTCSPSVHNITTMTWKQTSCLRRALSPPSVYPVSGHPSSSSIVARSAETLFCCSYRWKWHASHWRRCRVVSAYWNKSDSNKLYAPNSALTIDDCSVQYIIIIIVVVTSELLWNGNVE